ncbi:MAG: metallophosphoesterase family protein [Gemmatimonadetes bacterium]|jgi:acid phosphatase type 7|nr:metallophosphoesterase family protein [Gemmatimonadota bacterium]
MKKYRHCVALLICGWVVGSAPATAEIRHIYLAWADNPSTTMSVHVQTLVHSPAAAVPVVSVVYDTVEAETPGAYRWRATATGVDPIHPLPGRTVHSVKLTGLIPGQLYYYRVLSSMDAASTVRRFRTIPDTPQPLRFIVGGDMGIEELSQRLQRVAAAQAPQFALIGGDLAYANGDWAQVETWDRWFDHWDSLMVTPTGEQIPIVAAIGNHEVRGGYGGRPEDAGPYLRFLPQSPTTYYDRAFGPHLGMIVLDSGHLEPHGGRQARWLAEALQRHDERPFLMAAYHVPLFPGFRQPGVSMSRAGRQHWQPLFDRHALTVGFEHHDHMFKRSVRIRGNEEEEDGVLYLGDGSFGRGPRMVAGPRQVHLARRWYLERIESRGHIWRVDVDAQADSVIFTAIDADGVEFDRVSSAARN